MAQPVWPLAERVSIICWFCDRPFEVLRPRDEGRIRREVRCWHCGRAGIVAYGEIGSRTLITDRRKRERRIGEGPLPTVIP